MAAGSPEDQMDTLEVEVADSHGRTAEALESSLKDVNNSSVSEAMYIFIRQICSVAVS